MKLIFQFLILILPIGLFGQTENRLKIYPDPFHNVVVLENAHCVKSIDIIDKGGKVIVHKDVQFQNEIKVSTDNLQSGLHYTIKVVKMGGVTEIQTFFKN